MATFRDLSDFFARRDYTRFIIAADAEPRIHEKRGDEIVSRIPAGGVSIALDPIARASNAIYIARGKTKEDHEVLNKSGAVKIQSGQESFTLKRIFPPKEDVQNYYDGFSNQTMWPLCHVAFESPIFSREWFDGYKRVNKTFAEAIKREIKGKTFLWINDYQLSFVPHFLNHTRNTTIALFWHIPWPTWEVFRILPYKKEILESLLSCDLIAFHRGYQARNFIETVEREFEARIDDETGRIFYKDHVTTVANLPMGIDTDIIEQLLVKDSQSLFKSLIGRIKKKEEKTHMDRRNIFPDGKVILGVDRLDYTKGLILRMKAIEVFFRKNPGYIGKISYVGLIAPSREKIPSYMLLRKNIKLFADEINKFYGRDGWKPIHLYNESFSREELLELYKIADLCLVTPRDDGMNLVSKEFVIAASTSKNPGMIVLSQFAGSAIDLEEALVVNPYDVDEVAVAIKRGIEMNKKEKARRIKEMAEILKERNIYEWAMDFVRNAELAVRENRKK